MLTHVWQRAHQHRLWFMLFWCAVLAAIVALAMPARAAEQTNALPFVNNFATARFKLLSTISSGDQKISLYGGGEAVLPDRSSAWLGSAFSNDLIYTIQIGSTVYQRIGGGPWKRTDGSAMGGIQAQPLSAQFNLLQEKASAIINFGPENVGNVPATRYQVWLSGTNALALSGENAGMLPAQTRDEIAKLTFKYDFWIGTQDSFLHQQNIEITVPENGDTPAVTTSILTTFYDINDPNISVNAPQ